MSRHLRFQIAVTTGVSLVAVCTFIMPDRGEIIVAVGTLTNLIWIWE